MATKKKGSKKSVKHHVIAKNVHPKHIAALIAPTAPEVIAAEPHVVVAVPKTLWQRFLDLIS